MHGINQGNASRSSGDNSLVYRIYSIPEVTRGQDFQELLAAANFGEVASVFVESKHFPLQAAPARAVAVVDFRLAEEKRGFNSAVKLLIEELNRFSWPLLQDLVLAAAVDPFSQRVVNDRLEVVCLGQSVVMYGETMVPLIYCVSKTWHLGLCGFKELKWHKNSRALTILDPDQEPRGEWPN